MLERMRRGWKRRSHVFFRKGVVSMILRALTLNGDVLESTFYDQATGAPKLGYSVKLTVLDTDADEKYECQLTDGFPTLEHLKDLKRQGQPADVLRQELPPKMTQLALEVLRVKGKSGFMTLVCRLAQAA